MKRPLLIIFFLCILLSVFTVIQEPSPKLGQLFKDDTAVICSGEVCQITQKENLTTLHLKNISFYSIGTTHLTGKSYGVKKLLVYSKDDCSFIKIKNRLQLTGTLVSFSKATNPGQFNEYFYYKGIGLDFKIYADNIKVTAASYSYYRDYLYKIKHKISRVYDNLLPPDDAGILSAMLLGMKSNLPQNIKEIYQKNGIAHILAISGLHVSLIGTCLFRLLKKLYFPNETAIPISIAFLVSYGFLTDFSVSTNRSVVMLILSLIAILIGRTYDFLSAISLSGSIILLQNPYQIVNSSFLLSFGAVLAIAVLYPALQQIFFYQEKAGQYVQRKTTFFSFQIIMDTLNNEKIKQRFSLFSPIFQVLANSILLNISVQLVLLPIILYFYFEIPIYSMLLNLFIIPLSGILLALGIFMGILGLVHEYPAKLLAGAIHNILCFYECLCEYCFKLPCHTLCFGRPALWQIFLYYFILSMALFLNSKTEKKRYLWLLIGLFIIFHQPATKGIEISMLDVGQGESIFITSETKKNYLIDGGSTSIDDIDTYRITPFLKSKGITTIDYVILTHMDADHISGIQSILEKMSQPGTIQIKHLIVPDTSLIDEDYNAIVTLANLQKIPVSYFKKEDKIVDGNLSFTCLHPYKGFQTNEKNNYSLVLYMKYLNFSALFTGDVSEEGEEALLKQNLKKCTIYKTAHHGSRHTNSMELLYKINPDFAIVSAGSRNKYGHPHKETLERFEQIHCPYFSTSQQGSIHIKSNGFSYSIQTYADHTKSFNKNKLDK